MTKLLLVAFLGLIIMVAVWVWALNGIDKEIDKKTAEYKELVGEKVVVNKDTLLITDYNMLLGKFYLSNGTEVSKEYAKKKIVKK